MTTKVKVRKRDADKVLAAVKARFKGWFDGDDDGPVLLKDWDWLGTGGTPYAVVWEGGPYDWAIKFTGGDWETEILEAAAEFGAPTGDPPPPGRVDGVFLEPITGWALGIYPD